ncbi:GNAT family N-acetyltransferase [Chitinophaga parva]|uniref:GNAT family N-acetyltransferase n=1 Tax=Chitinophaga parva TaxID=2169414 RepID=A0A2T7BC37_9BACT|nr:GNAT family N-acetyltransferase [Chitinophaga parva]PUZ22657.1 GNAT family N-acetyltransferase [Chitinophaga parva]
MEIKIRSIAPGDNAALAHIVRAALREHNMAKPGTVYTDESTDHLYELYQAPRAAYFVAEENGEILGGAGIGALEGDVCELQKMYLAPAARGKGLGKKLILQSLAFAKANGYTQCYLETSPELAQAVKVYAHLGFRDLPGPLGNTGHFGCDRWMIRDL